MLTIDDAMEGLRRLASITQTDVHIVARQARNLVPSFCGSIVAGQEVRYETTEDASNLDKCLQEKHAIKAMRSKSTRHITIYWSKDHVDPRELDLLSRSLEIAYLSSMNFKNTLTDRLRENVKRLTRKLTRGEVRDTNDLAKFIHSREKVTVWSLFSNSSITGQSHLTNAQQSVVREIQGSKIFANHLEEASRFGKPIVYSMRADSHSRFAAIFPTASLSGSLVEKTSFICVSGVDHIDRAKFDRISQYIEVYLQTRYRKGQTSTLADIQTASSYTSIERVSGQVELEERFIAFCKIYFDKIVRSTKATGCRLSLYEFRSFSLTTRYITNSESDLAKLVARIDGDKIGLRKTQQHIVPFAFGNTKILDNFVYLPDTNSPHKIYPKRWQKTHSKKLRGNLQSSPNYDGFIRSHLALPLIARQAAFGVVDFYSDEPDAFTDDLDFFVAAKSSFELYWQSSFLSNDYAWFTDRMQANENIHELKNLMAIDFFNPIQKEELERLIISPTSARSFSIENLSEKLVRNSLESWIENGYGRLGVKDVQRIKKMLRCDLRSVSNLDDSFAEALMVILRNLVSNTVKWGDLSTDTLALSNRARPGEESGDLLRIYYKTHGVFLPELLDSIGIAPQGRNSTSSYGLFIIGVLTRLFGGRFSFDRSLGGSTRALEILLPIRRKSQ